MALLRDDLAACAAQLHSKGLCNILLASHYMRVTDERFLATMCVQAARKAEQFSPRDVATAVYALGKLGRADAELLPRLLSRARTEAAELHAVELLYVALGLADLR
eukprot:3066980-Prymnesium_polylepis.1